MVKPQYYLSDDGVIQNPLTKRNLREVDPKTFLEVMLIDILDRDILDRPNDQHTCTVYSVDHNAQNIFSSAIEPRDNENQRYAFRLGTSPIDANGFLLALQNSLEEHDVYFGVCKEHFQTLVRALRDGGSSLSINVDNLVSETKQETIVEEKMTAYMSTKGHVDANKSVKETKMSRQKKIGVEIAKRAAIDAAMQVGQQAVLELLTLLGVRKTSKIYKFFASDFASGVLKAGVGLFLIYCPFTQDEKYQMVGEELLTQAGVTSAKEALNVLLAMLAPQAQKFVELISNLNSQATVRIAETDPEKKARVQSIAEKDEIENEPLISGNLATA